MRTVTRTIAVMAVMAVALYSNAARAADPPTVDRGPELCFELVDKTVITGRIDAKTIAIKIASGDVLRIPVADLASLTVGLNDHAGLVKRVDAMVKALDSAETRQSAERNLIALGPRVRPFVARHADSDVAERSQSIARILKAYQSWRTDHPDEPVQMSPSLYQIQPKSRVCASKFVSADKPLRRRISDFGLTRTSDFVLTGTVLVRQFRLASPYGPVTIKLEDVRRIRRAVAPATPDRFGHWAAELHDKTHVRGTVIDQSLRVQTPYGAVVIPFAQIQKAILGDDGKSVRVQCWGSDWLAGTLGPKTTISIKTGKGMAVLPAEKIARVVYGPLTFKGHSHYSRSIAFSPDGKRLASGSADKTIKLWDTVTGKELFTLKGHLGVVTSVAFSPDGNRLASGSSDGTIKLWDLATRKEQFTIKGHSSDSSTAGWSRDGKVIRIPIFGKILVAFSPDGKSLASGCEEDETIKLWDIATGKERLAIKAQRFGVRSLAISPDGKRLAAGHDNIKLWDTVTGKASLSLKGYPRNVFSLAFSPDGKYLASGGRRIMLWDTASGKELRTLGEGSSVAFSPDGKCLASGGGSITLWDTASGKTLCTMKAGGSPVVFSPDGKYLASGGGKTIAMWNLPRRIESPVRDKGPKSDAPVADHP